ncbi:hypothetical protein SUGI_0190650 [Cryptomeria japonica]|nr:hypothetical protein SUGI_0190650 [Cryptomeria japonica]
MVGRSFKCTLFLCARGDNGLRKDKEQGSFPKGGIVKMNPEKFINKTNKALQVGVELAQESSHAQFTPIRLAIALIEDNFGLLEQTISSIAGGDQSLP